MTTHRAARLPGAPIHHPNHERRIFMPVARNDSRRARGPAQCGAHPRKGCEGRCGRPVRQGQSGVFEEQLAAEYNYDDDQVWKKAHAAAKAVAEQAQDMVAHRCEELGIPRRFAPSLHLIWFERGENAVKVRRAELSKVPHAKIDQLEKQATLEIDRASADTQTKLLSATLESAEAQTFLAAMPTAAQLMPNVNAGEIQKQLGPRLALLSKEDEDSVN
jgi:hypothetical protein